MKSRDPEGGTSFSAASIFTSFSPLTLDGGREGESESDRQRSAFRASELMVSDWVSFNLRVSGCVCLASDCWSSGNIRLS